MARKAESCFSIILKLVILVAIMVGLVIAGYFFLREKLDEYFNRGDTIEVPDFRGRSLVDVFRDKPHDIIIEKRDEKHDSRHPKDHVVAQFPEPGTRVRTNKKVYLTISLGSRQVKVPDLVGRTMRETDLALFNAQLLNGNTAYIPSQDVPRDRVIAQSPTPGSSHGIQEGVDLLVSSGRREARFPLPNLAGRTLDDAKTALMAWGLRPGRTVSKKEPGRPKFAVLGTVPTPYEMVAEGTLVDLLISSGEDAGTARTADLKRFEFQAGAMQIPVGRGAATNMQQPAAVFQPPRILLADDQISIPVETPLSPVTPQPDRTGRKVTFTMPDGFMPKELKFIQVSPQGRKQLYAGTHRPLEKVEVEAESIPGSVVQIYINDVQIEERNISG